jgi:pimeloyl-ACP methyl ester carboxylesterase
MAKIALLAASLAFLPGDCGVLARLRATVHRERPTAAQGAPAPARQTNKPNFLRVEALDDSTPAMFVMRGEPRGPGKLVFIHGICGHGLGYAQSFVRSAARHGTLIAPQGDRPCDGTPLSKWSLDTASLDARIVSAFHALGFVEPIVDVTVIGYSQGANRAESLARKWPARYNRLILIAGPTKVSPYGLGVRSAVMMAGTLDRQDIMQESSKAFLAAGRRARYVPLPNARHGAMGDNPEATMGTALDWLLGIEREAHALWSHSLSKPPPGLCD